MCVIMVVSGYKEARPSKEMIRLGYERNSHGAGVAWQENGKVKWLKGMDLATVTKFHKKLPFPYVLHFRAASVGTIDGPHGCHPFPVDAMSSTALSGEAESVLFHNGFWHDWKSKIVEISIKGHLPLPAGGWSDTRALAWAGSHLGPGFLELVSEKLVVLSGKDEPDIYGGLDQWSTVDDILVSNTHWQPSKATTTAIVHNGFYHTTPPASLSNSSATTTKEGSNGGASQSGATFCWGRGGSEAGKDSGTTHAQGGEAHQQGGVQKADEDSVRKEGMDGTSHPLMAVKCAVCRVAEARTWLNQIPRCIKCWMTADTDVLGHEAIDKPHMEFYANHPIDNRPSCELCHVKKANQRLMSTNEWICSTCWTSRARPPIRMPDIAEMLHSKRRQDAVKGITTIGRM
jgi:hypothetical protein